MTVAETEASPMAPLGGRFARARRVGASLHLLLAVLIAAAVFVQVYLIGGYIFGAGVGALEAHASLGWVTHTAEMALVIAAVLAWLPRTDMLLSVALVVIGTGQVVLAGSVEWLGALHPLFALIVLGISAALAHRGARRRGRRIVPGRRS